jgi:hypothetical protein
MSAGAFLRTRYQASYTPTNIHPIRIQPETAAAVTTTGTPVTNNPPTADINLGISAVSSLGKRARGLKPRSVALQVSGTPPTGYLAGSRTEIIALTIAFYDDCQVGATITYLGTSWTIIGKFPELIR